MTRQQITVVVSGRDIEVADMLLLARLHLMESQNYMLLSI